MNFLTEIDTSYKQLPKWIKRLSKLPLVLDCEDPDEIFKIEERYLISDEDFNNIKLDNELIRILRACSFWGLSFDKIPVHVILFILFLNVKQQIRIKLEFEIEFNKDGLSFLLVTKEKLNGVIFAKHGLLNCLQAIYSDEFQAKFEIPISSKVMEAAISNNHLDVVEFLINKGASICPAHLPLALKFCYGDLEKFKHVITLNESGNTSNCLNIMYRYALSNGYLPIVKFLWE